VQKKTLGASFQICATRGLVLLAGVLCMCLPGFANTDQVFNEIYKLPAGGSFQDGGGELRSVNGNVEVTESSGRFSAKTTNGDLRLELRHLIDGAPMNLETVNGSVVLGLPSNASADVKVHNMNGELYSDIPVTSTDALPGARAFHGRLGRGGGGAISVRTVNGGIHLLLEHPGA
jgi:hypothetical protein